LREEHRLRFFENRVLRRIFGPKREEGKPEGKRPSGRPRSKWEENMKLN